MRENAKESVIGLACPACQGKLEIFEGERILTCPYCGMNSTIVGERGVIRYQIKREKDKASATRILQTFLSSWRMAFGLKSLYEIVDFSIVYIPFWSTEAEVAAWVFGEQYAQNTPNYYVPFEREIFPHLGWNEVACDVAEFGIDAINLGRRNLELLDIEALQADGMVFEPIRSLEAHKKRAREKFKEEVINRARLYHIDSVHVRLLKERASLIYYPLWIARYRFRNRIYQVVIDGVSGLVRYGNGPGNIWLGAILMVFGMALSAFLCITIPTSFPLHFELELIWLLMVSSPFLFTVLIVLGIFWPRFGGMIEIRKKVQTIGGVPWWRSFNTAHKQISDSMLSLVNKTHKK